MKKNEKICKKGDEDKCTCLSQNTRSMTELNVGWKWRWVSRLNAMTTRTTTVVAAAATTTSGGRAETSEQTHGHMHTHPSPSPPSLYSSADSFFLLRNIHGCQLCGSAGLATVDIVPVLYFLNIILLAAGVRRPCTLFHVFCPLFFQIYTD